MGQTDLTDIVQKPAICVTRIFIGARVKIRDRRYSTYCTMVPFKGLRYVNLLLLSIWVLATLSFFKRGEGSTGLVPVSNRESKEETEQKHFRFSNENPGGVHFIDRDLIQNDVERQENSGQYQTIVINRDEEDHSYRDQRANATFLVLCRNEELYSLLETIQNIEDRFNRNYGYDWVFLNDKPFEVDFIYYVSNFISRGKLSFGQIPKEHWSYPPHIDRDYALLQRTLLSSQDVPYADSESYRHMCRFYLGFFYKHPLVSQYQYYWRIEPDVRLYCNVDYDAFKLMQTQKKKYAFAISLFEYESTIPTLWSHFKNFTSTYDSKNAKLGDMMEFVENDDEEHSYNLCHFWSNFEIADLSLFRNEHFEALFSYLDQAGGFYYERWGDAPVHTLAVLWLLNRDEIMWFGDIGYYHPPYMLCPQSSHIRIKNRCSCDPEEDFLSAYISCTPHALSLLYANAK